MKYQLSTGMAAASLLGLSMAGCGTPESAASDGSGKLETVKVGVIPIVSNAAIYLGQAKGFFKDAGIKLDIQPTVGGAAAVPAVVSGSFDFADSNIVSVMLARDKGLDIQFVTTGSSSTGDKADDATAVIVPADSPIRTPADLAGKTVSVNTLANIGDTTIRHVVDQDGGDQSKIKFVEVPFPDAEAAMTSKRVDAAWIAEPFLTDAVRNGARVVTFNYADFDPGLDIEGYFAKGATVRDRPELVQRFRTAMNQSLEYANANPQEVRDVVGTYTKISPELRAKMTLNRFRTEFNRDAARRLGEAAVAYGLLKNVPNLDELMP
jgi:NitT/TauT family transport system substrate-binding protein